MFDSLRSAGAAAGKMAKQASLTAEIAMLKEKVAGAKRTWGEETFEAYGQGSSPFVQRRHELAQQKITELLAKMQRKQEELDGLSGRQPVYATPVGQTLSVTVPPNVNPGDTITVETPEGRMVSVVRSSSGFFNLLAQVIPAGCHAGSAFQMNYS